MCEHLVCCQNIISDSEIDNNEKSLFDIWNEIFFAYLYNYLFFAKKKFEHASNKICTQSHKDIITITLRKKSKQNSLGIWNAKPSRS